MKRSVATLTLILCLSFPVLGGHTLPDSRYCACAPVEGVCPCCGAILNGYTPQSVQDNETSEHDSTPIDKDTELGILLESFFMWLELKA